MIQKNIGKKIAARIYNSLKTALSRHAQRQETSAYLRLKASDFGDEILEDLTARVFGRTIPNNISNEELRAWVGEVNLLKYILLKTFKEK